MKTQIFANAFTFLLAGAFLTTGSYMQAQVGGVLEKFPTNPKPFDGFGAPVSGLMSYLASDKGRRMLQNSPHPVAKGLLRLLGENASNSLLGPFPNNQGLILLPGPQITSAPCSLTDGTRFNLEPRTGDPSAPFRDGGVFPMPQNEEAVDFIRIGVGDLVVGSANDFRGFFGGLGGSVTGVYVHRAGNDCTAQFEDGLPAILDANGVTLFGAGDPVIAADPSRGAFFAADLHFGFNPATGEFDTSIGVFRTDATTLTNTTVCPPGTHAYNDSACWPIATAINPQNTFGTASSTAILNDKPHLAVDERKAGKGSGDVYITNTILNFSTFDETIELASCNNHLSSCSAPQTISGTDGLAINNQFTQFSNVKIRPDGLVTVTYVNFKFDFACFSAPFPPCLSADLKYVSCTPAGDSKPPVCSSPVLITTETQPIGFISQDFRVSTYPTHDHQLEPDGTTQTIVAWTRCKVPGVVFGSGCPDADVVMVSTNNNGGTWSSVVPVNANSQDQFFPWVSTDRITNTLNIIYYSSENDVPFKHRLQVLLNQIAPGTAFPNPSGASQILTSLADDPAADLLIGGFFFGDYISVAARGGRLYAHYTYNTIPGIYNGIENPEQNNHLVRLDY